MTSELVKQTVIREFTDGSSTTSVTNYPLADTSRRYYEHANGHQRSIKNRWDIALVAYCPKCFSEPGSYCSHERTKEPTAYPHNARFKEGLLQIKEKSKE